MRIGSLFSGAGGLDMAVEAVFGGTVAWHCEVDPVAAKVLAAHWPDVPNLGDVIGANWNAVQPVDVLCGGFPCQDVSSAGRRAGLAQGTRSGLWYEMARIIGILRPAWVVIENVRGLLSAKAHRAVESADAAMGNGSERPVLRAAGAVLGDLADLGYDAQWVTVSASSVGAPHRRERVFMLAHAAGTGREGNLPKGEPRLPGRNSDEPVELLSTPQARDWKGANGSEGPWQSLPRDIEALLPTPQAHDAQGPKTPEQIAAMKAKGFGVRNLNETAAHELLPTPCASDGDPKGGPNNPENRLAQGHHVQLLDLGMLPVDQWGKYGAAVRRWESLTRPAPSPVEPNKNGKPRLNAAFSEWMMGWAPGHVTDVPGTSRNDQLRIAGNGVCPQQAYAAILRLLSVCAVAA